MSFPQFFFSVSCAYGLVRTLQVHFSQALLGEAKMNRTGDPDNQIVPIKSLVT